MPFDQAGEGRRRRSRNVLGGVLEPCSTVPLTGFFRDGCCNTSPAQTSSATAPSSKSWACAGRLGLGTAVHN